MGNSWSLLTPQNGRSFIFISESDTVDRCFIMKFAKQHFAGTLLASCINAPKDVIFTVPVY